MIAIKLTYFKIFFLVGVFFCLAVVFLLTVLVLVVFVVAVFIVLSLLWFSLLWWSLSCQRCANNSKKENIITTDIYQKFSLIRVLELFILVRPLGRASPQFPLALSWQLATLLSMKAYISHLMFHGVSFLLAVISCFNRTIQITFRLWTCQNIYHQEKWFICWVWHLIQTDLQLILMLSFKISSH